MALHHSSCLLCFLIMTILIISNDGFYVGKTVEWHRVLYQSRLHYNHRHQDLQSQLYRNIHTSPGTMILWWSTAILRLSCESASTLCCCEWGAHTAAQPGCLWVMWAGMGAYLQRRERKWEIGATARELSLSDAALLPAAPCQLQMRNFRHPVR